MRCLVLLSAVLTVLLGGVAVAATCPVRYSDPVGDGSGPGADITAVEVARTSTSVRFRVTLAKPLRAYDGEWDRLEVQIDTPPAGGLSPSGLEGLDYRLEVEVGYAYNAKKGEWIEVPKGEASGTKGSKWWTFPVVRSGSSVSFAISRRKLGNPKWFNFVVSTDLVKKGGFTYTGVDTAPALMRGTFYYDLRYCAAPPAPR